MKMGRAVSYWSGVTASLPCSALPTSQDADRISLENIVEESGITSFSQTTTRPTAIRSKR